MTAAANPADIIIEGEFRVVAERTLTAKSSPNTRRAVARILCWNAIFVGAVLVIPHLIG
ncbi:hypothetical protein [Phenylobacterium sp.]|uniref:hypothetical protein n=1 Tax=Phenylobacterium sp. TaxID=1871053 RepID=UPI0025E6E529|nr:hypothetical protein [Phenylobacterium sp.]MBX3485172.1 hypothetical protein [Phenylobacterium sp.]MCW5758491.1 hypothetical protein [Phenylobacterium sp.]